MSDKRGTLWGVGLGPGDPELVTVKAARLISEADVVAFHSARHGKSVAKTIAAPYFRGQDDPNLVIIEEMYDSRDVAEAALNHPELPAEIANAGVEMSSIRIDYLDEVASGPR